MNTRSQSNYQIVWTVSMIVLLALAALAPMAGGFLQQHHRAVRQSNLRRGRTDLSPVRFVLADHAVEHCFFPKKNELEIDGLRYDVVSVRREGNRYVFNAIPDVKETRICAAMLRSILFPSGTTVQKTGFALLDYLPNEQILPLFQPVLNAVRTVFLEEKARVLAGFEWMFAPPPDRINRIERINRMDRIVMSKPFLSC